MTSSTDITSPRDIQDVLVIGAGPAGLSAATGLARGLYKTLVFDSGVYRNDRTRHMHNVPGWDHQAPAAFRKKAGEDLLARYHTIRFEKTAVQAIWKTDDGMFEVIDDQERIWKGRKVILATGVRDIYPDIPGYDQLWAHRIYHCLFCDGYEQRGADSVGVLAVEDLANPKAALHMAYMAHRLSKQVTIYTNGAQDLGNQVTSELKPDFNFTVENGRIQKLTESSQSEAVVHLDGDRENTHGFIVHKPKSALNGPFAKQLGLELTEQGDIKSVSMFHETSVPGVFAVGDCATSMKGVSIALAMGALSAGGSSAQLQQLPLGEPRL